MTRLSSTTLWFFALVSLLVQGYLLYKDIVVKDRTSYLLREHSGSVKTLAIEIQHRFTELERKMNQTQKSIREMKKIQLEQLPLGSKNDVTKIEPVKP